MQIVRPHPRPTEAETGWRPATCVLPGLPVDLDTYSSLRTTVWGHVFIKQSSECSLFCVSIKVSGEDFLVGPVVGNPPANSGDQFLVQEDPTCRKATRLAHHNYWSPQALKPVLCNRRSLQWEACTLHLERRPCSRQLQKAWAAMKTQCSQKINYLIKFKVSSEMS